MRFVCLTLLAALAVTLSATAASGERDSATFDRAKALALGIDSTCALTDEGGVKCWGYNGHGELGNGQSPSNRSIPTSNVIGLVRGVIAITAGVRHHCALTAEGAVKCWGADYEGALGTGTTEIPGGPVTVSGVTGASAISAGHDFSCVLVGGGVECWGDNSQGMLGNGTKESGPAPVHVLGLGNGVTAIESDYLQSCALMTDGGVRCWGGLFGTEPVQIAGLNGGAKAITSRCALMTDGGVKCWNATKTAADVPGLSGIRSISTGAGSACALGSTGGVKCWGDNEHGQLGNGTTSDSAEPVDVSGLRSGVAAVATSGVHSCAVMKSGSVRCWGAGGVGQLGNGSTSDRSRPVGVIDLGPPKAKLSILSRSVRVTSHGTAPTSVRCGADAGCRGTLMLVGFGSRVFTIKPDRTKVVAVKLTIRGLRRVMRAKRLQTQARAVYEQPDASRTTRTRTVVLVAPKR